MPTTAELYVHYHNNPILPKPPLTPVVSDETTVVLPYVDWIRNKCASCGRHGASGIFHAHFSDGSVFFVKLCANCGLNNLCIPKACGIPLLYPSGWGAPKFIRLDLLVTLTYQSRTVEEIEK